MNATPTAVSVAGLSVAAGDTRLIDNVSLEVSNGEWLSIIGPNGAGKSTLLRAIAGLTNRASGLIQTAGTISISGSRLSEMSQRERARRVAWVPQTPVVPAGISVRDYVLLGRTPHLAMFATESKTDLGIIDAVLEDLDLSRFASRKMATLSGGERQRAVIARALAQQADLILLDEPISALDLGHQQELLTHLDRLRLEQSITIITTMHDLTLAGQSADRLVLLSCGQVVANGSAREVLTQEHLSTIYGASVSVIDHDGAVVIVPSAGASQTDRTPQPPRKP